jgi:hypothetical protein
MNPEEQRTTSSIPPPPSSGDFDLDRWVNWEDRPSTPPDSEAPPCTS